MGNHTDGKANKATLTYFLVPLLLLARVKLWKSSRLVTLIANPASAVEIIFPHQPSVPYPPPSNICLKFIHPNIFCLYPPSKYRYDFPSYLHHPPQIRVYRCISFNKNCKQNQNIYLLLPHILSALHR